MAMFGNNSMTIVIDAKNKTGETFKKVNKGLKGVSKQMKIVTAAAGIMAIGIGKQSVEAAMVFGKSMSNVSTLIDTSTESMEAMKKEVLDMSTRVPVAIDDLTSALYDVRSAGIDAASAMEVLETSAVLGVAGLGTTKEATNLLTTAINAFGLQGRDSTEVADVLFKTVKAGKTDIAKLSEAFGKMAGNAKAANVSFEDAQAATAALTALTGKTSEAQNALAQVFLELTIAGGKLDKALQENGIGLIELNELIGDKGLVGGMKAAMDAAGLTEVEFKNLFSSAEGGTAVYQLLTDAYDLNNKALGNMKDGTIELNTAFEKQNAEYAAQYQILKNQLNVELIKLGIVILPIVETVIKWVRENPKLTKEIIITTTALTAFLAVLGLIGLALPVITGIGAGFVTLGAIISAFAIAAVASIGVVLVQIYKLKKAVNEQIDSENNLRNIRDKNFNKYKNLLKSENADVRKYAEANLEHFRKLHLAQETGAEFDLVASRQRINNLKKQIEEGGRLVEFEKALNNEKNIGANIPPPPSIPPPSPEVGAGIKAINTELEDLANAFDRYKDNIVDFGDKAKSALKDITKIIIEAKNELNNLLVGNAKSELDWRKELAKAYIDQEKKVADLETELANETDQEKKDLLIIELEREKGALERKKHLEDAFQNEINAARKRASLTDFERKMEDLNKSFMIMNEEFQAKKKQIEDTILEEEKKYHKIKELQEWAKDNLIKFEAQQEKITVESINRQIEYYNKLARAISAARAGKTSGFITLDAGIEKRANQKISNVNVNINNPVIQNEDDIEKTENQIERVLRGVILNNNIEV